MTAQEKVRRAERIGSGLFVALFAAIVVVPTSWWTVEILVQTYRPPPPTATSCAAGVRSLLGAVRRATSVAAASTGGEREAIAGFRAALEPEWSARPAVGGACRSDPRGLGALRELDQLRYAEERAVRQSVGDVARQRRRAVGIEREFEAHRAPSEDPRLEKGE